MAWNKKQGESGKEQNDWQWTGGGQPTSPSPGVATARPPVAKPKPLPALPPQMGPRMVSPGPTPVPIDAGTRVPPPTFPGPISPQTPIPPNQGIPRTGDWKMGGQAGVPQDPNRPDVGPRPAVWTPADQANSDQMAKFREAGGRATMPAPSAPPPSFDMSAAWGITPPGASNPPVPALTGLQAAAPAAPVEQPLGGANPAAMQEAQKRTSMQDQVQQNNYLAEQAKKGLMTGRY
jgi:hypothetical protein